MELQCTREVAAKFNPINIQPPNNDCLYDVSVDNIRPEIIHDIKTAVGRNLTNGKSSDLSKIAGVLRREGPEFNDYYPVKPFTYGATLKRDPVIPNKNKLK